MKTFHSRDFRYMMTADDIETANDGNYDSCRKINLEYFHLKECIQKSK